MIGIHDIAPVGAQEAGCDEVGRGCLAGPVVAAVVILPPDYNLPGLDDSKKVASKRRLELAAAIRTQAVAWAVAEASVQEIDQYNILQATWLAMHRAIEKLQASGLLPSLLLVDGNRFKPYPALSHRCIVGGDGLVPSIAAASILAKTERDAWMRKLALDYPGYGWEHNVGYPTATHRQAIAQLGLTPWHRRSFCLQKSCKQPSPSQLNNDPKRVVS